MAASSAVFQMTPWRRPVQWALEGWAVGGGGGGEGRGYCEQVWLSDKALGR